MNSDLTMELESALAKLNGAQRDAASWGDGSLLVLAGPGSGKTMVLTTRLATLLQQSSSQRFRVLALTFTNMAAAEMLDRVQNLMGGQQHDRAFIGTFHAFCIEVLQSHGAQIGLNSSFRVFGLEADREAVLATALRKLGEEGRYESKRILAAIDRLQSRLIVPIDAARYFRDRDQGEWIARIYSAYGKALVEAQALDFNGLLMETWRLFHEVPGLAQRYRRTFRYWLVDEFQDTNRAQYGLLKELAGGEFQNLFVVADDDQIIYRWNGASYQQLEQFRRDFSPTQIQLPTNYRCPRDVVAAANSLISHNSERTSSKAALLAGKMPAVDIQQSIDVHSYSTDEEERVAVSEAIRATPESARGHMVVLARNRFLLDKLKDALRQVDVKAMIASRRDDFLSPAYIWMQAVLRQVVRPEDLRNFEVLVTAFAELSGLSIGAEGISDQEIETGKSLLRAWVDALQITSGNVSELVSATDELVRNPGGWRKFVERCARAWPTVYGDQDLPTDVTEDCNAWQDISREINRAIGRNASLDEFLHRLDITSKEPSPAPGSVRLMTIHGAKGKEFRTVFLIGLAEGELPSWQSLKNGAEAELEEERRNCFVAITRTEERLILTYAGRYRGWSKAPSRFLGEMGLLSRA
jgi:DNA helicase II / ATP-dependent DNA helicase PcrA